MLKWSELSPRERDALVAEKVMGWRHVADSEHWAIGWNGSSIKDACDARPVRAYSEFKPSQEIAAAWEVVEHMRGLYGLSLHGPDDGRDKPWYASFIRNDPDGWKSGKVPEEFSSASDTAPEAICLAALRACGVEIE